MFKSFIAPGLVLALLAAPAVAQAPAQPATPALTLSGADWRVTSLTSGAKITDETPGISFGKDLRVSGSSGCNRFMGGYSQDGQSLKFTELAGTMMACPGPRMEFERQMLDALGTVTHFAITPGGALELFGAQGLLLRAER